MFKLANTRQSLWFAWLLVLPALAVTTIFMLYPAVQSLYLSLHEVAPFTGEKFFVGMEQYRDLLSSPEYWLSARVTLYFALLTVPTSIVISLMVALLLDQQPFCRSLFRTIFLLPVGISPAMGAMLWVFMYNPTSGFFNYLLHRLGMDGPSWLADPTWALVAVSIVTVWKEVGFNVIFFLAGLANIPQDVQDAALIDGAGFWHRLRYVVLPLLSPTLFFVSVISVIHACESFGQIHILTRGGPADATNVLVYRLYRDAFEYFRAGNASAQAVLLFILILLLTYVQFYWARRRVHYQ